MQSEIHYTSRGDLEIVCQVVGDGPRDRPPILEERMDALGLCSVAREPAGR